MHKASFYRLGACIRSGWAYAGYFGAGAEACANARI
jgi:hypothetical protein